MFRKRIKKEFPPGTFIPTPARVLVVLQLCIVFTILISSAGYPFMGEMFAVKSKTLLFKDVMGIGNQNGSMDGESAMHYQERLQRNVQRFSELPKWQQSWLQQKYATLQSQTETPFLEKFTRALYILIFELPGLERMWIALALVVPLMLLMRMEGAAQAAWLLPIIVLCYALDNRMNGQPYQIPPDTKLFPTEKIILENYLKEPLAASISEQQKQLLRGWKMYLITEWEKEIPSQELAVFELQAEAGEYKFNVARLGLLSQNDLKLEAPFHQQEPYVWLLLYFIWNLFFAWFVNRSKMKLSYPKI
jgi:hypothetical protein